jgi:hypothetical protein
VELLFGFALKKQLPYWYVVCVALMRVNSTNVLDEGLRIKEVGRQMNSKVKQCNKVCIESKRGDKLGLLSICP